MQNQKEEQSNSDPRFPAIIRNVTTKNSGIAVHYKLRAKQILSMHISTIKLN